MELTSIENKEVWEQFLSQCTEKTFLQSWNWGECNKAQGQAIWRFGIYHEGKLLAVAFLYKISARRGTFLFIPHGPVFLDGLTSQDKEDIFNVLIAELRTIAKEERASFIRVAPVLLRNDDNEMLFWGLGFKSAPLHMHPEVTWELDITPPEEELLASMRKTTRYLIRQAQKNNDILIEKSTTVGDLEKFWPVYQATAKRHHFTVFSKTYLQKEFNAFMGDKEILLLLGNYKGEVVSSALFVFWQGVAFYHHSGSLSKYQKIPVSYLLMWEAIREAQKRGCHTFNFWGIAPDLQEDTDAKGSKHPWAGLSLYKMGFGGYRKEYVKTQDFIISPKYWINYIIERLRKRKRNL